MWHSMPHRTPHGYQTTWAIRYWSSLWLLFVSVLYVYSYRHQLKNLLDYYYWKSIILPDWLFKYSLVTASNWITCLLLPPPVVAVIILDYWKVNHITYWLFKYSLATAICLLLPPPGVAGIILELYKDYSHYRTGHSYHLLWHWAVVSTFLSYLYIIPGLRLKMDKGSVEPSFVCPTCGVIFATKKQITRHLKTHDKTSLKKCHLCSHEARADNLEHHIRLVHKVCNILKLYHKVV